MLFDVEVEWELSHGRVNFSFLKLLAKCVRLASWNLIMGFIGVGL